MDDSSDLPTGWHSYRTADGAVYYHHAGLGITQWAKPLKGGAAAHAVGDSNMASTPSFLTGQLSESPSGPDLEAPNDPDQIAAGAFVAYQNEAQRYFDVTTEDIQKRLVLASLPYRLLSRDANDAGSPFCLKPDMYGPIWICATVGFSCFAGGHVYAWASQVACIADYKTLCVSMTLTFIWFLLVPVAVRMTSIGYGMSPDLFRYDQVACVYGYSLWPIVPLCLLASLPSKLLQLIFVFATFGISFLFIAVNLQRDFLSLPSKSVQVAIVSVLVACHAVFFLIIPSYYFALPKTII